MTKPLLKGGILLKKSIDCRCSRNSSSFRNTFIGCTRLARGRHSSQKAASQLPKGIGGRAYLNSTGAVFTAKIKLPDTVKNDDSVSTPYIYSGFRATSGTEADIGLQYSKQYNVWKPLMKVGAKNEETYTEGKDKFTYKKASAPKHSPNDNL